MASGAEVQKAGRSRPRMGVSRGGGPTLAGRNSAPADAANTLGC